jgi:hypothetical protein
MLNELSFLNECLHGHDGILDEYCNMRMNLKDRAGGLATANLHWERSLNVVFLPYQLRTVHCWPSRHGVLISTSHVPMLGKPYFGYSITGTFNLALGVKRRRE